MNAATFIVAVIVILILFLCVLVPDAHKKQADAESTAEPQTEISVELPAMGAWDFAWTVKR